MTRMVKINLLLAPLCLIIGMLVAVFMLRVPMEELTTERLAEARAKWSAAGIADYDMRLRMHGGEYGVRCRNRVVEDLTLNGTPVTTGDPASYSVDGLLAILGMELEMFGSGGRAPAGGSPVFMRVLFDQQRGYVKRYLRSGSGFAGPQGRGTAIEVIEFTPIRR